MLNSFLSHPNAVAAELFASSWCNLDCTYCYIPKHNNLIKSEHQRIIDEAQQVTPLINRLKKLYNDDLEILSHWGSEPSLTIKYFKNFYIEAIKVFPKLKGISFSSNFMSKTNDVIDFIKTFSTERQFTFDLQISLDGPPWITDVNRRGGATDIIIKHVLHFIEEINKFKTPHIIKTHFKPTISRDQYSKLLENGEILNYYKFFDDVCSKMAKCNINNNVLMAFVCDPTIVCPDDYTTQDGINFNKLYEITQDVAQNNTFKYFRPDTNYYPGFEKIALLANEYFVKQKMFTCSAGDSQFGVSDFLHPCHDTFYIPSGAEQECLHDLDRINSEHEAENVRTGRIEMAKKSLCVKIEGLTDKRLTQYIYENRAFHDFVKQRLSYSVAVIMEMAYAKQISKCYLNPELAVLLGIFMITRHSCPTKQKSYLNSTLLIHPSFYRLFGNGLMENFIKRYCKRGL